MDTPRIYVACLAAYNSGYLHGKWLDAIDEDKIYKNIYEMLADSPIEGSEEWAIHDYSGFGDAQLDEYESIPNVIKIAEFITEHGELGVTLLGEFSIDDAQKFLKDCYHGSYDSEVDFARSVFEECYGDAIPENLIYYFDHKAFARDLFVNDYFSIDAQGKTHVFSLY